MIPQGSNLQWPLPMDCKTKKLPKALGGSFLASESVVLDLATKTFTQRLVPGQGRIFSSAQCGFFDICRPNGVWGGRFSLLLLHMAT